MQTFPTTDERRYDSCEEMCVRARSCVRAYACVRRMSAIMRAMRKVAAAPAPAETRVPSSEGPPPPRRSTEGPPPAAQQQRRSREMAR